MKCEQGSKGNEKEMNKGVNQKRNEIKKSIPRRRKNINEKKKMDGKRKRKKNKYEEKGFFKLRLKNIDNLKILKKNFAEDENRHAKTWSVKLQASCSTFGLIVDQCQFSEALRDSCSSHLFAIDRELDVARLNDVKVITCVALPTDSSPLIYIK